MPRNTWLLTVVSQTSELAQHPDVTTPFRHELKSQTKINFRQFFLIAFISEFTQHFSVYLVHFIMTSYALICLSH